MKPTNSHIEEYFKDNQESEKERASRQIFEADDSNIDLKTDLDSVEIKHISTMKTNDTFLINRGLKPVFSLYYNEYLRLRVSKDRGSRKEFVKLHSDDKSDELQENIRTASSLLDRRR
ncbi:MAG: hypothetical protein ACOCZ5_01100 [bacterium]